MKSSLSIQPTFDFTGDQLAIAGMEQAKENADRKIKGWSDKCWELFISWLNSKPRYSEFMLEEFRNYCKGLIEDPPDQRAYAFLSK